MAFLTKDTRVVIDAGGSDFEELTKYLTSLPLRQSAPTARKELLGRDSMWSLATHLDGGIDLTGYIFPTLTESPQAGKIEDIFHSSTARQVKLLWFHTVSKDVLCAEYWMSDATMSIEDGIWILGATLQRNGSKFIGKLVESSGNMNLAANRSVLVYAPYASTAVNYPATFGVTKSGTTYTATFAGGARSGVAYAPLLNGGDGNPALTAVPVTPLTGNRITAIGNIREL